MHLLTLYDKFIQIMDKIIFIICDGLSDRPIREFGGKTPLEKAHTHNLDKLVQNGLVGLIHTVDRGIRPGSDVAHLSLFGYDPKKYYTGRGIFETIGISMDIKPGDIAFRGNFATVDNHMIVRDRRAGRIDHTKELIDALSKIKIKGIQIFLKKGVGHRVGVVLRGKNLSDQITDVDPHDLNKKILIANSRDGKSASQKTAEIINEFTLKSYNLLKNHPFNIKRQKNKLPLANILLVRGGSQMTNIPSFKEKYDLKAACIAGAGLYKGIAKSLGMDIIETKGTTGKPDSEIKNKIEKAINILKDYDFIFIHIKGADSLSEDGNYEGKRQFIEKIDHALKELINLKNVMIVVTADHTTSSKLKIHTADPVPVVISYRDIHTDDVSSFGEHEAHKGRLGHIKGIELMPILLDYLGKAPLYGA